MSVQRQPLLLRIVIIVGDACVESLKARFSRVFNGIGELKN